MLKTVFEASITLMQGLRVVCKMPICIFFHHEFCSSNSRDIHVPLGYVYYFYTLHKIFIPPRRQAKSPTWPKNRKQLCPKLADKLQAMTSCQSFFFFAVLEMELRVGRSIEITNDSWKRCGEQAKGQFLLNPSTWLSLVKVIRIFRSH